MCKRITVAKGDGIGSEIMVATLRIMQAAGVKLEYDFIKTENLYSIDGERGYSLGQGE
jgi:isocitrate dehydrogenase